MLGKQSSHIDKRGLKTKIWKKNDRLNGMIRLMKRGGEKRESITPDMEKRVPLTPDMEQTDTRTPDFLYARVY